MANEKVSKMPSLSTSSGIRDNHKRGAVADFLKAKIRSGSRLSVVSAYFTIYAYDALREHLDQVDHLDFLFGEPRFIASLDPDKTEKKAFIIEGTGLHLANGSLPLRLNAPNKRTFKRTSATQIFCHIRNAPVIAPMPRILLNGGKIFCSANSSRPFRTSSKKTTSDFFLASNVSQFSAVTVVFVRSK